MSGGWRVVYTAQARKDARKLARGLRSGELTAVYVPTRHALEARSLVRTRWRVVQKLTRCKNQIKASLTFYGIAIPDTLGTAAWSQRFLDWLEEVRFETPSGRQALDVLLLELQYLMALRAQVTEQMRNNNGAVTGNLTTTLGGGSGATICSGSDVSRSQQHVDRRNVLLSAGA